MGAIVGRIEFDGHAPERSGFDRAFDALAHYGDLPGPVLTAPQALLGQHRFDPCAQTRDPMPRGPEHARAPLCVADAILDNRAELAETFGWSRSQAMSCDDTAFVLQAWNRWGTGCVPQLLGDFAFALWSPETRTLFLVRDHVGTRPLYWSRQNGSLVFGTDLAALTRFSDLRWEIDDLTVARFLANADRPTGRSFYQNVHSVAPGEIVSVSPDAIRRDTWWDPAAVTTRPCPPEDAALWLRETTERAVACRTETEHPVASHLSGGIDSTIVTRLAARALAGRGQHLSGAYSWAPSISDTDPDMGPQDERHLIAQICTEESIPCHFAAADTDHKMRAFHRSLATQGSADLSEEAALLSRAQANGVRVILSGWGGDEAASAPGYGYLAYLLGHARFAKAARLIREIGGGGRHPKRWLGPLWHQGIVPALPGRLFTRFSPFSSTYPNSSFAHPRLLDDLPLNSADQPAPLRLLPHPTRYLSSLIAHGHLAMRMETWAHWSAGYGIIHRYPLCDRRVMELVLSLPPQIAFAGPWPRPLARRAFDDLLPSAVSKTDPANERFRNRMRRDTLRRLSRAIGEAPPTESSRWVDRDRLNRAIRRADRLKSHIDVLEFAEICAATRVLFLESEQTL